MKTKKRLDSNTVLIFITIGLFILMYAVGCAIYQDKGFSNLQTFLNILINNAGLICVTCGMTCVMLTGGIDISVGSVIAMDCMLLVYGMTEWKISAVKMVVLVLVIGLIFGAVQGFLVGYLEIQPFIVTMAGMFFARGMTAVICSGQISITEADNPVFYAWANSKINLPEFLGKVNRHGKIVVPYMRPTVLIALVVLVIIFLMLKYTKFGRNLYAVGGNQTSATMMGLNVKKTRMFSHKPAGNASVAMRSEMDAIASAVIGGTLLTGGVGNVIGSLFGVLINGTITVLVNTNGKLLSSWANIATAALLCVFIILQSVFALVKAQRNN